MKTFEDFLRRLYDEGARDVPFRVNEYGVSIVVQLADKGPKTFVVVGDTVSALTEPVGDK